MPRTVPTRVTLLLSFLFALGFSVNALAFIDLRWTHWLLAHGKEQVAEGGSSPLAPEDAHQVQRLLLSILNVRVAQCTETGETLGTGFVVKPGFVATAAHVLGDQQSCSSKVRLIDSKGREHAALVEGISADDDLALLRISDTSLPALPIADSAAYESPNEIVRLVRGASPVSTGSTTSSSLPV
jgi:S1-C subfamily serine protease